MTTPLIAAILFRNRHVEEKTKFQAEDQGFSLKPSNIRCEMETYATTGPKGSNPPKPQVGVADYFAILGVGEELIWKHAQKKQILGIDNNVADGGAKPEEDDAKLLERFYREIVDCTIWAADESSTDATEHPTTMAYKNSANNQPSHPATLPSSPIPSDVTSTVGTDIEKAQMEGWTIVQQTRPIPTAPVLPGENVPPLWSKGQIFEANLDPFGGVNAEILHLQREQQRYRDGRKKSSTPLKDLRDKVQSSFQQRLVSYGLKYKKKYYVSFRRRAPDEPDRPAVANVDLFFVRLHKASLEESHLPPRGDAASVVTTGSASIAGASTMSQGAAALFRVAEAGKQTFQSRVLGSAPSFSNPISAQNSMDYGETVSLDSKLKLPSGFDEWSIPSIYQNLRFPNHPPPSETPLRTILFPQKDHDMDASSSGVEAVEGSTKDPLSTAKWKEQLQPKLISRDNWKGSMVEEEEEYIFVPILAMRRQRCGEEERFHEDPALVELAVSFTDHFGQPVIPYEEVDPFEEEDEDAANKLLEKTAWALAESKVSASNSNRHPSNWNGSGPSNLGKLCLIARHNAPSGFCDAAFATSVLDRFPYKNYKGLPLPEEELPMFCYPTGCRLHRAKFCDAPLPQYYGFVVKNERGDSIYVSCVSFMEPLSRQKREQLIKLSEKRCRVGLPHGRFLENRMRKRHNKEGSGTPSTTGDDDPYHENFVEESNILMMGFEEMTTFENKTICLVSRYPYWSAFRRFLSHLQSVSGSATDLPLERYISHLLLSVPVPQPGGPSVLVPLPTLNLPMMMAAPPRKDLPLLDLPFNRLFSCLDVPTVVTVVLGFLALERKVIVMSSRPSLVLDVCELLRSLLFPFDLCAPYVPRLTEPFMSCLEFPGAIFAGIHDDGTTTGLATVVREDMPEDSTIVDLDSGSIDCNGDRMDVLNTSWGIIPPGPRAVLVSEIETLCRDAGIAPGQEPLDGLIDPAFEATMPATPVRDSVQLSTEKRDPLDDRAIRDSFLRFFCSVLGGYERFLVVPDVDFLISGNEWFDSKGFLSSVSEEKATFVGALVATQLFQSFIQRRTEASDVHCLLFDECVAEFHSSSMPYGRLGGDVESAPSTTGGPPQLLYSLLVDQSATESTADIGYSRSFDGGSRQGSDAETNASLGKTFFSQSQAMDGGSKYTHCVKNATGDLVSMPTRDELPVGSRFIYCVDGNPTFPDRLNPNVYLPRQPESWLVEMSTASTPMLTRSEKEIEEADRRRKMATTYRGLQTQRRCLWQLPKLMGSHVLGAWLVCIPALVSQPYLSHEQQSKYLLRALGALRLLRSKQRIVPDEAAYRALIVACGRTMSDRRMELVRLFGLLRSDGIFPSAVTLGQYTKALAEGYSKQSSLGPVEDEGAAADVNEASKEPAVGRGLRNAMDPESRLNALDGNLTDLEDSGRKWRQKSVTEKLLDTTVDDLNTSVLESKGGRTKKKSSKPWLPVSFSSSFVPPRPGDAASSQSGLKKKNIRLLALWSRTKSCDCKYLAVALCERKII